MPNPVAQPMPLRPGAQLAGPPGRPAPPRMSKLQVVLVGLLLVGAVGYTVASSVFSVRNAPTPATRAEVGECIDQPPEGELAYVTECDSSDVVFKVLGKAETVKECLDIAGTTSVYQTDSTNVCLAGKNEDISQALNTIEAGDCLMISAVTNAEGGTDAKKSECVAGAYPVKKVLRDVDRLGNPMTGSTVCSSDPEATNTYSWSIERAGLLDTLGTQKWDFTYCLADPLT